MAQPDWHHKHVFRQPEQVQLVRGKPSSLPRLAVAPSIVSQLLPGPVTCLPLVPVPSSFSSSNIFFAFSQPHSQGRWLGGILELPNLDLLLVCDRYDNPLAEESALYIYMHVFTSRNIC